MSNWTATRSQCTINSAKKNPQTMDKFLRLLFKHFAKEINILDRIWQGWKMYSRLKLTKWLLHWHLHADSISVCSTWRQENFIWTTLLTRPTLHCPCEIAVRFAARSQLLKFFLHSLLPSPRLLVYWIITDFNCSNIVTLVRALSISFQEVFPK